MDVLREGRQEGRQGMDPQTDFQGALLIQHADTSAIAPLPPGTSPDTFPRK